MDTNEFERLYAEEFPALFRTAFLITADRQEALDLTQEAFARAVERWRTVRKLDRPGAWLQRVVTNLAISSRRRMLRRTSTVLLASHEATVEEEESDPELLEALRALTPAQRVVIVLRFYADRSVVDVAEGLGKRPGTVTALTAQGLARLREHLVRQEVPDEARG